MKSIGFATFIIEDLGEIHSRALAYALSKGISAGSEIKTYEYFAWITDKWTEYRRLNSLSETDYVNHAHFDEWLWADIEKDAD